MNLNRYSIIHEKNSREIVLLRGSGCNWRCCDFCDYHLDTSSDASANFMLNRSVLSLVRGIYGRLKVINSGSFCDLDENSIDEILSVCTSKGITQLHIECHWRDRFTLAGIRIRFNNAGISVKVKTDVETIDEILRDDILFKGMEHASVKEIPEYADEVRLLVGITGQTEQSIRHDIETCLAYFERVCINLMTENSTKIQPDNNVLKTFMDRIFTDYKDYPQVDILLENTDFGVGENNNAK